MPTVHFKKSNGLGDSIEKVTKITGIKAVVDKVSDLTGVDCGCEKRKEALNNPDLMINKIFYKKDKDVNK